MVKKGRYKPGEKQAGRRTHQDQIPPLKPSDMIRKEFGNSVEHGNQFAPVYHDGPEGTIPPIVAPKRRTPRRQQDSLQGR